MKWAACALNDQKRHDEWGYTTGGSHQRPSSKVSKKMERPEEKRREEEEANWQTHR